MPYQEQTFNELHQINLSLTSMHSDVAEVKEDVETLLEDTEALKSWSDRADERITYLTSSVEVINRRMEKMISAQDIFKDKVYTIRDEGKNRTISIYNQLLFSFCGLIIGIIVTVLAERFLG